MGETYIPPRNRRLNNNHVWKFKSLFNKMKLFFNFFKKIVKQINLNPNSCIICNKIKKKLHQHPDGGQGGVCKDCIKNL